MSVEKRCELVRDSERACVSKHSGKEEGTTGGDIDGQT
jgi:hypothetical protein